MPISFLPLSWSTLQEHCFELAQTIQNRVTQRNQPYDRIVSISRGGLVVARLLSDALVLPISNFTLVSYSGINTSADPQLKEELGVAIEDETVLLVDEIVDSGKTLEVAIEYLNTLKPKTIDTAVVVKKPHSTFIPTYTQLTTTDWVVFPYEIRETIEDLVRIGKEKNQTLSEIRQTVEGFGFPQSHVNHYFEKLS